MIFSSNILLVVTFSYVLHLDALRRQIELKLKVKTEIPLCMPIMTHCHPYIHSTTVLCDSHESMVEAHGKITRLAIGSNISSKLSQTGT